MAVISPAELRSRLGITDPERYVEMSWDTENGLYVKVTRQESIPAAELPASLT